MIYVIIYALCVAIMLAVFAFAKSQLKLWQKTLAVIFAPIVFVIMVVGAIWIFVDHIIKHGFHNVLPRKKNKAYPLDKDDFKYWPKDTILCGNDKMNITDFNKKFGKNLSLDDVYGKGYIDSLSPEEYYLCKVYISGKYGLEPNMPNVPYKDAAIALAQLFVGIGNKEFSEMLSEDTHLILYAKEELIGKDDILKYFSNWVHRATEENIEVCVTAKWNQNQCRPALYVKPQGYREMIVLFRLKDNLIVDILFGPSHIQDRKCGFHDMDEPPYNAEYIAQFLVEDEATEENHIACPTCGTDSALLDWYSFDMPVDRVKYRGLASICPDCKRVVELLPRDKERFDTAQEVAFPRPIPDCIKDFNPRLRGLYSFETNDEQMDFYDKEELDVIKTKFLNAYRKSGDIEAGNNYAIIQANSGKSQDAISLFTELSEGGCQNAMANNFTVLWANEGEYQKAIDWLKYIEGAPNPSLMCLWNLAVLYYWGKNLTHNTLHNDILKTKKLLWRIKDIPFEGHDDSEKRIIADAQKFYLLVDTLNEYSLVGQDIHRIITTSIVKTKSLKDKGEFFNYAKALSLTPGLKLGVHIADHDTEDIGDESFFYLYDNDDNIHKIYRSRIDTSNVDLSLIKVEPTAMGAWELYLLLTSPTIMPVFWHGGYSVRKFIFTLDDLKSVEPIRNYDFSIINHDGVLLPVVELSKDKRSADVYCTYWNDWKGLVREHVKITFNTDGSAEYGKPDEFVFYHYDCGICF